MNRVGASFATVIASLMLASPDRANTVRPGDYVEHEVLITFKAAVDFDAAKRALDGHSLAIERRYSFLSEWRHKQTVLVRDAQRTTAALIAALADDPAIEVVEPNHVRRIYDSTPNDPLFNQLWGLRNTGQPVNGLPGTAGADIKFIDAWRLARPTTNPPVVAVIDTGLDYSHPDLSGNIWTNLAETSGNGLDDDTNGYPDDVVGYDFADGDADPSDSGYHGTHVAGTIAAVGNNLTGVIGVNYQARIMVLKASSDGRSLPDSAIIGAVEYATLMKTLGVNVVSINASFGGGDANDAERAAIGMAGEAGIIYCAAAGNGSRDHDLTPDYPASYRLSNMIVVAASGADDVLADFSDYGATTVDLAAPGVNIISAVPVSLAGTTAYVRQDTTSYSANGLTYAGISTGVTGMVYDCGLGYPEDFPAEVSGNIALISRGTLYFSEKVDNAMTAGAVAAIIYNHSSGNFNGTLQYASSWIPAITLSQDDGLALKALLPTNATVVNTSDPAQVYQLLDGTSMATPHVAGAVAFAAMNFPGETVTQRVQRILANADWLPALQDQVITGGRLNLLRIVDTDRDGLPDWWVDIHFGHPTGADPGDDPDKDGARNIEEWLAGTDPNDDHSVLRLTALPGGGTNGFAVSWPSVTGKIYRLERATNLLTGFDSVVKTNIAATAPLNIECDTDSLPGEARYYRLRLEP